MTEEEKDKMIEDLWAKVNLLEEENKRLRRLVDTLKELLS